MAITYTDPISGLDLLKTSDDEISKMGRFIYENHKYRGYETSIDNHIRTVRKTIESTLILFKAYDGDILVGFRTISPALNSQWVKPKDDNKEAIKFRDWLVSEKVDLDAIWTSQLGVNPSYYKQGVTKELTKRCAIEAKKLGLIYKITFSTNKYYSDNPIVYSDIDFGVEHNGVSGKLGYVKL